VSGRHHLHSANAMFNKHQAFGLKTKKKKKKTTKKKHTRRCPGITSCVVLRAVKMWRAVAWIRALCSVVGAFIYGTSQKMEAAGTP
jgi:hypothetical protein